MTPPTEVIPPLVGMVHLPPLPGAPAYQGSMGAVVDDCLARAELLVQHGFGAVMVENFGDVPYFADSVPPETVAAMTACVEAIRSRLDVIVGVNVLRNDALSAIAVAAATGARLVRVNVLTGSMDTDQGPIVGRAAEVARRRAVLAPSIDVWADVFVKHAAPPSGATIEQTALDTWERGGADALVVSGIGTGHAPELERIHRVALAVPDAPLVVGSGASVQNLSDLAGLADHIIVGTALELDGRPGAPLDPARVGAFVEKASAVGLVG